MPCPSSIWTERKTHSSQIATPRGPRMSCLTIISLLPQNEHPDASGTVESLAPESAIGVSDVQAPQLTPYDSARGPQT